MTKMRFDVQIAMDLADLYLRLKNYAAATRVMENALKIFEQKDSDDTRDLIKKVEQPHA